MKRFGTALVAASMLTLGCVPLAWASSLYFVDDADHHLYSLDLTTRAVTDVGAMGIDGGSLTFGDLAYDTANHTMYYSGGRGDENLYTVNLSTGAATLVGTDNQVDMFALGYDPVNNTLYGATAANGGDELGSINKSTGAFTPIASIGKYNEGLVFNRATSQMVLTDLTNVYTVNLTTGATTLLGTPGFDDDNGITYNTGSGDYWVFTYANSSLGDLLQIDPNTLAITNQYSLRFGEVSSIAFVPSNPEPATLAVLGVGAVAMVRRRAKRSR